jgi:hypothetical protein
MILFLLVFDLAAVVRSLLLVNLAFSDTSWECFVSGGLVSGLCSYCKDLSVPSTSSVLIFQKF